MIRWLPAVFWMTAIFVVSSLPSSSIPSFAGWLDLAVKKGGHFLAYGILAQLYLLGLGRLSLQAQLIAWILCLGYAASDELHQSFVVGRNASLVDVGVDLLGATVGIGLARQGWLSLSRWGYPPRSGG